MLSNTWYKEWGLYLSISPLGYPYLAYAVYHLLLTYSFHPSDALNNQVVTDNSSNFAFKVRILTLAFSRLRLMRLELFLSNSSLNNEDS